MKRITTIFIFVALALVLGLSTQAQAQLVLKLAVPDWQRGLYTQSLFEAFYAQHREVYVEVVTDNPETGYFFFDTNEDNITNNLSNIAARVSSADVLAVNTTNFGIEATRTGAYLDLAPIVNGDSSFNTADFQPVVWDAFQWDRGIWAVPVGVSPIMLLYDASVFDAAGLAYPNASWTMADLASAARTLAVRDESGSVTAPGLTGYSLEAVLVSLTGQALNDRFVVPNEPRLNQPELRAVVEEWQALLEEGVYQPFGNFDPMLVPLAIDRPWRLYGFTTENADWRADVLPGGGAGLFVDGFAVSAGTQHPELAYALVKYLSEQPDLATNNPNFDLPARISLRDAMNNDEQGQNRPPTNRKTLDAVDLALQNAISPADTAYFSFLRFMFQSGTKPESAAHTVDEAQQIALEVHARITNALVGSPEIAVVSSQPPPEMQPGQSALNIRIESAFSPIPNQEGWNDYVETFVASEPTVGRIELHTGFLSPGEDAASPDCWYSAGNALAFLNPNELMALDPFMDADPRFNRADFLRGTLEQLQLGNQTWGYPIAIQPVVMTFNRDMFTQDSIPTPDAGWTIEQLVQAMRDLKNTGKYDGALFNYNGGMSYMLQLIAAFGGIPVDTTGTPVTYDLSNPANIEAIRQALDLAREGLITYYPLSEFGGAIPDEHPITVTNYNSMVYHIRDQVAGHPGLQALEYVTFPSGSQYAPAAFVLGAGYISAASQNPEACYRFIAGLSEHPELMLGMPVRQAQVHDPILDGIIGEPPARLYRQFADRLQSPNALIIGDESSGAFSTYIEHGWLARAFDRYVLEGADLNAELGEAQRLIDAYRQCLGADTLTVSLGELTPPEREDQYAQYTGCAVDIDPSLAGRYGS